MMCVNMMCSDAAHGLKVLSHAAMQALVRKGSRAIQLARDTVVMVAKPYKKQGSMFVGLSVRCGEAITAREMMTVM
jgi:hypothetical protein